MMKKIWNIYKRWQAASHVPLHERIKGFTLIELLVVVAIIGLLAAIVIVPLNIARTKGSNARNLETDAAMYHNLGDSLVLQMLMDDGMPNCIGTITGTNSIKDSSGYGHDGTPVGGVSWSSDSPFGTGCSVLFDGSTGHITSGSITLGPSLTISAWVNDTVADGVERTVFWGGSYFIGAGTNSTNSCIQFELSNGTASPVRLAANCKVGIGKWQFLVFTNDGASTRAYINGVQVLNSSQVVTAPTTSGIDIGKQAANGYWFGNIDNVRIYDRALDTSEIQKLYAMDAMKHGYAFVGDISPLAR